MYGCEKPGARRARTGALLLRGEGRNDRRAKEIRKGISSLAQALRPFPQTENQSPKRYGPKPKLEDLLVGVAHYCGITEEELRAGAEGPQQLFVFMAYKFGGHDFGTIALYLRGDRAHFEKMWRDTHWAFEVPEVRQTFMDILMICFSHDSPYYNHKATLAPSCRT